jgi:non-specific serine/threonine protein kinase
MLSDARFGTKKTAEGNIFVLRAKTHPFDFLTKYIPLLVAEGFEVYGEEELKKIRINRSRPTISFGITSGIDWFDLDAVVRFGEIAVSLKDFRRAVRKNERFIKLADGSIGEIPPEWLEKYKRLFGLGEESDEKLRFGKHHLTMLDQLFDEEQTVKADREFKEKLEKLKNFEKIRKRRLPKHFLGNLRPYQKHGFDWLYFLHEYGFGGCLADDMGTGKTVQMLAFLQSLKERGGLRGGNLLVVPRSLVFNWQREAEKFTPRLKILDYSTLNRTDDLTEFDDYDLVITTYSIVRRDIEKLIQREFNYVILDEAQAVKNPLGETGKAVRLLRARHRLTMTGTPIENNTLELWSQFSFLNPGLLGSADYFRENFTNPIEKKSDEDAVKLLRRMIYPFILRRTKEQVAAELPPRTERRIYCEPDERQRKFYLEKRDHYRALLLKMFEEKGLEKSRFQVLEGLLRLRQICNHPALVEKSYKGRSAKLEMLVETLETLRAEGHKALVFSQFVQMLKFIEKELKARKIPYTYLDGKTKKRQEKVDEFQNDPSIPFFLISLKAGGVGLNLTAADYVLHVDPWWNPAVEQQATDRTHRIGQEKPVFVYKFVMRDSVEEKILTLQEKKRNLSSQLISTEASFFKSLTAEDIQNLFG